MNEAPPCIGIGVQAGASNSKAALVHHHMASAEGFHSWHAHRPAVPLVLAGVRRAVTILHGQRRPLDDHPEGASSPQKRKGKWLASPKFTQAFHALLAAPLERFNAATARRLWRMDDFRFIRGKHTVGRKGVGLLFPAEVVE